MSKPNILVARAVFPEVITHLQQHFKVHANQADETWSKAELIDKLRASARVLECHHVSGEDSYVLQVVAFDLPDLERFLGDINGYGETRTSIVFSTPIPRRGVVRPTDAGS